MNYSKTLIIYSLKFYRQFLSPWLGGRCRFIPTCSEFALEVVERHSLGRALWLICKRLLSCHPLHAGGFDPVRPEP